MVSNLDELMGNMKGRYKNLKKKHVSLQESYEELKTSHENLLDAHEKLKEAHNSHIFQEANKVKVDIGITCDLLDDISKIDKVSKSSISTSRDDLLVMSCSSNVDSCMNDYFSCDPLLIVENDELRNTIDCLTKALANYHRGENTYNKMWECQRFTLKHEGLGYILKKNNSVFIHKKTTFIKECGLYCSKSVMSTSRPLKLLHMDLFGPTTYRSIGENSYGLVVVNDYSRYTWVFFLSDKSNVFSIFKGCAKRAENEFDFKVKKIRIDNGSEFKNSRIEDYCGEKGIKHEFSAKYTSQQNGVVESKNQTLIDMARSLLSEYNVSENVWTEAINTTCHGSNRLYCHRLLKKTPYKLLIGRKPNISYFWVFRFKCYTLRKGTGLSKFESKCDEGFLIGYSLNSKSYRVYNQSLGLVEESSDVEFDDTNSS
jgi:transposase InsO family protein